MGNVVTAIATELLLGLVQASCVHVASKVVDVVGFSCKLFPVRLFDQRMIPPTHPLAVNVTNCPAQIVADERATTGATGIGLTLIISELLMPTHPFWVQVAE